MSSHIKTRPLPGKYVVRAAGAVLGETTSAVELTEGSYPPVIYIPRADVAMAFLETSATTSRCPHKGDASYFTIQAKSGPIADAAWSYETPAPGLEAIAGHLAFYEDKVAVEQL